MKRTHSQFDPDALLGIQSRKLPQLIRKQEIHAGGLGECELALELRQIEPMPFGQKLKLTYGIAASCKPSPELLSDLGYKINRLKLLGILPEKVPILQTTLEKELLSADVEKEEVRIFDSFSSWFREPNTVSSLRVKITKILHEQVRKGRVSPFAQRGDGNAPTDS